MALYSAFMLNYNFGGVCGTAGYLLTITENLDKKEIPF
jgi:hypothetical protein